MQRWREWAPTALAGLLLVGVCMAWLTWGVRRDVAREAQAPPPDPEWAGDRIVYCDDQGIPVFGLPKVYVDQAVGDVQAAEREMFLRVENNGVTVWEGSVAQLTSLACDTVSQLRADSLFAQPLFEDGTDVAGGSGAATAH